MRVLFIPLEAADPRTNERTPTLIRVLLRHHTVIGLQRVPHSEGSTRFITYLKYLCFAFAAFRYGMRHRKEFDVIFCENAIHGLGAVPVALITRKPLFLDCHGHELTYGHELGRSRLLTFLMATAERIVGKAATAIITVSERDRGLFVKDGFPPDNVVVIPTSADFSICDRSNITMARARERLGLDPTRRIILFIGKRAYLPNRESAEWINEQLAPAIANRLDAVILLSGSGPIPPHLNGIVRVTGFVPDIYELIVAADVCIAPVWKGVGIMTKVIDTMACGKPTVVSRFCTQGIPELVDGENAMIAGSGHEFVEKTIYLLEHTDKAQYLGMNARKTVEEHYNWDKWERKLDEILRKCLERKGHARTRPIH